MPTRRGLLRTVATGAAIGSVGLGATTGSVAATHTDQQPDHVTISYDQDRLETYRPLVVTSHLDVKPTALYGWIATSTEYDYDWYVYFAEYAAQEGVSSYDSHYGDHEPVYVGVADGSVERLLYSGYHWIRATAAGESIPLYEETHPALYVINPWHHYALDPQTRGSFVGVRSLVDVFEAWLDNGMEESLAPGTVVDPATMRTRGDWWRLTAAGLSLNELYIRTLLTIGFQGADQADTERLSS